MIFEDPENAPIQIFKSLDETILLSNLSEKCQEKDSASSHSIEVFSADSLQVDSTDKQEVASPKCTSGSNCESDSIVIDTSLQQKLDFGTKTVEAAMESLPEEYFFAKSKTKVSDMVEVTQSKVSTFQQSELSDQSKSAPDVFSNEKDNKSGIEVKSSKGIRDFLKCLLLLFSFVLVQTKFFSCTQKMPHYFCNIFRN